MRWIIHMDGLLRAGIPDAVTLLRGDSVAAGSLATGAGILADPTKDTQGHRAVLPFE